MDFSQNKLTRAEWNTIEIPVSLKEKEILELIKQGYHDINIHTNENQSLFSFIKIVVNPANDVLLFKKYFEPLFATIVTTFINTTDTLAPLQNILQKKEQNKDNKKHNNKGGLNNADQIRLNNLDDTIAINKSLIFEFLLIDLCHDLLKSIHKKSNKYAYYLYTLLQIKKSTIANVNTNVLAIIDEIIGFVSGFTKTVDIINNAHEYIEKNKYLMKYEDRQLYSHQKELFTVFKKKPKQQQQDQPKTSPKLILYTAPTSTGKTVSPLGLSEEYRIIFVCAARHIGLALAKSAISIEKKVAFAFGCETASDIRLHFFSAIEYTINKRSGGIGKVDNSVGDNVEIMICDIQSYLTAMHYMLSFNDAANIILYWDEPTITLDYYETHALHAVIHRNWAENQIPNVVLSCATLPGDDELQPVFADFRCRFDDAEVHSITSFDYRKSIPIIDKSGFCVLPHYLYENYEDMRKTVKYCLEHKTLLRYFDLREIIRFIQYVEENEMVDSAYNIDTYFEANIAKITMNSIKEYYLDVLNHMTEEEWNTVYDDLIETRQMKFAVKNKPLGKTKSLDTPKTTTTAIIGGGALSKSHSLDSSIPKQVVPQNTGILLTTSDAYTLTDGPTIFLTDDVHKIGTFYIQQSNIAPTVFQKLLSNIINNNRIIARIEALDEAINVKTDKKKPAEIKDESGKQYKVGSDTKAKSSLDEDSEEIMLQITKLRAEIRAVTIDPVYVPNSRQHQLLWTPTNEVYENAFCCSIGEEVSKEIMMLDIENHLKVLLLLGIGLFVDNMNIKYMEIMKMLADNQQLFIIISSSDYVYGTNYQFCHGIIGKDLQQMTQQKTLQALGRIGRSNVQQEFSARFRDDAMIKQLFEKTAVNIEADNMCRLFTSD